MTYAKITDNALAYPTAGEFPRVPNFLQHDALMRSHGYLPLIGEPEQRDGYAATPSAWHLVEQTATRTEPRQTLEDVVEDGEVVGQRMVMRDTEVTVDASYIQVDEWTYEAVPEPPAPTYTYSKYRLHRALAQAGVWDSVWHAISVAGYSQYWNDADDLSDGDELFEATLENLRHSIAVGDIALPDGVTVEGILEEARNG